MIMLRSRSYASDTVTGECQSSKRREAERSTFSSRERICQQNSPYASELIGELSPVRTPSRLAATARLAMPPGLEPMPCVHTSVPGAGSSGRPVKMMSR
ncbi:hypothetical protein Pflav_024950 [Phytohabitans flavus]|uniref:Uncharacterized protein n=1 Tax=Phytohabitans flavus TaxID=1076124 RepID=A0A6F8XQH7_9ACTN|nr:hypothetical protein [Phytohabitans flavus]BCB76085.1 hypothetical protein Pflav_024950 [Phytohabitans flavus]